MIMRRLRHLGHDLSSVLCRGTTGELRYLGTRYEGLKRVLLSDELPRKST